MDSVISKRRLCLIYVAMAQMIDSISFLLFIPWCTKYCQGSVEEKIPEAAFYSIIVFPVSIGPTLAFTVGDGIYVRQV